MKTKYLISCLRSGLNRLPQRGQELKSSCKHIKNYFSDNRDKRVALLLVMLVPVVLNVYLIVPDIYVPYYEQLDYLVFSLSESIGHILIASAWFITIKKEKAFQYLPFAVIIFSMYQIIAKIPIAPEVPWWVELASFVLIVAPVLFLLYYIKKVIITNKVQKLNHGLMQPIKRLKGLPLIDIPDPALRELVTSEAIKCDNFATDYFDLYKDPKTEGLEYFYLK